MKKDLMYKIKKLIETNYSDERILNTLNLSRRSFGAYKSHLTREKNMEINFMKYTNQEYILLKIKTINKKLSNKDKSQLEKILEKLENSPFKHQNRIHKKIKSNLNKKYELRELNESEIRTEVIKLKRDKLSNEKIYKSFQPKYKDTISAFLAHFTMGTYHKRGMIK